MKTAGVANPFIASHIYGSMSQSEEEENETSARTLTDPATEAEFELSNVCECRFNDEGLLLLHFPYSSILGMFVLVMISLKLRLK